MRQESSGLHQITIDPTADSSIRIIRSEGRGIISTSTSSGSTHVIGGLPRGLDGR